jgi:hypothetical protein
MAQSRKKPRHNNCDILTHDRIDSKGSNPSGVSGFIYWSYCLLTARDRFGCNGIGFVVAFQIMKDYRGGFGNRRSKSLQAFTFVNLKVL